MKKIINGKKYNTETAEEVGNWNNGLSVSDFNHCSEHLYKKKTGEYFLHGSGGALTKYSERVGDMFGGGEEIIPLSEAEAKKWAEVHISVEEYEEIFGEVEE